MHTNMCQYAHIYAKLYEITANNDFRWMKSLLISIRCRISIYNEIWKETLTRKTPIRQTAYSFGVTNCNRAWLHDYAFGYLWPTEVAKLQ